ncbi:beta/gamma crystallin-related protein [Streptomyces sp. NPDC058773]|uniref:beta/gamma crystallin-related protein n=1 Tax=Streptomyces sp. NPDC058773 TaxID=3346632 RepID=UPI0036C7140A
MRMGRIAAAGAAAAVLTLCSALPASAGAAPADSGTPKPGRAKVTLYQQPDFKGRKTVLTHSVPNLPAAGLDEIGSARNTGKRTAVFYQHTNYHGARFSLAPGESESHFGDTGMWDKVGALKFK